MLIYVCTPNLCGATCYHSLPVHRSFFPCLRTGTKRSQQLHVKFRIGAFREQQFLQHKINMHKICIFSTERVNPDYHSSNYSLLNNSNILYMTSFLEVFKWLEFFLASVMPKANLNKKKKSNNYRFTPGRKDPLRLFRPVCRYKTIYIRHTCQHL